MQVIVNGTGSVTSGTASTSFNDAWAYYNPTQEMSSWIIKKWKEPTKEESPEEKQVSEKAEKSRRRKKVSYLGKFVFLEHGSKGDGSEKSGVYFCIRQSEKSIYCIWGDVGSEKTGDKCFCLDKRQKDHYNVIDNFDDPDLLKEIFDGFYNFLTNYDTAPEDYRTARRAARTLFSLFGFKIPERAKAAQNLPLMIGDQLLLSRRMQSIVRQQFCSNGQKQVTAVLTELFKEFYTILVPIVYQLKAGADMDKEILDFLNKLGLNNEQKLLDQSLLLPNTIEVSEDTTPDQTF